MINKLKTFISRRPITVGIVLFLFLAALFIPFLSFTLSIAVSYKVMRKLLSNRLFESKLFVLTISVFFYVVILQAVIMTSWLFSANFSLMLGAPLTLIAMLIIYFSLEVHSVSIPKNIRDINLKDIVSLFVCAVALGFVVILPVERSGDDIPSNLMVLVNQSVDDASHMGLLNDRLQFDRGVILNSDAEGNTRSKGILFYPSGWHSANAIIIKTFSPSISTGTASMLAYILTKIFWFILLIYVFVRTTLTIYTQLSKKEPSLVVYTWIAGASLLFTTWFIMDVFASGFYSFIPQLIIIPIFILSLIQLYLTKKHDYREFMCGLVLPAALCLGSASSWLLLFPVFVISLTVCIIDVIFDWGILRSTKGMLKNIPKFIFFLALVISALFALVISTGNSKESVSFLEGILLNGGISTYPNSFYTFIFVGVALSIMLAVKNKSALVIKPILNYVVTIIAFSSLLYALQLYLTQANSYYYYKSLSAFTLVGAILCMVGIAYALTVVSVRASNYIALMTSAAVLLLALQFVYIKPSAFSYIKGDRVLSSSTNKEIIKLFNGTHSEINYYNQEVVIYYPENNLTLNEVASTLVASNKPYSECYTALKTASFMTPHDEFSTEPILENCRNKSVHITYYVSPDSEKLIKDKVRDSSLSDRVTVKIIDS